MSQRALYLQLLRDGLETADHAEGAVMKRHTTRAEDAAFLQRRVVDATHAWKVGDGCLPYRGREVTSVVRIDGDIIHLANGDALHRSHMRRIPHNG